MTDLTALVNRIELPAATSLVAVLMNLAIAGVLTVLLAWHYEKFGRTLTNRSVLARVLPLIALSTVLVITVVQTSLALALGLVGALSIVRFRTPIKEPEELAYLFLSIAIGLGLGANHRLVTVVSFAAILVFLTLWSRRDQYSTADQAHHLYLNIECQSHGEDGKEISYEMVQNLLTEDVRVADLRRLDSENGTWNATFYIDCADRRSVMNAVDRLKRNVPGVALSLVDRQQSLGL